MKRLLLLKRSRVIPTVTLILSIIGLVLFPSCQTPQAPPTQMLPGTKLPPAYSIQINFPSQLNKVSVEQGGSVTLPVTVYSKVVQPIKIRLILEESSGQLPQFIQYNESKEFVTLAAEASFNTQITISISDDAKLGSYHIGIHGLLQEPVNERSGEAVYFDLAVIAR
jgi:hypothetical protein